MGRGGRIAWSSRQPLARRATIGRFIEQDLRIFGRAAPLGDGAHDDEPVVWPHPHTQMIASLDLLRGLCAVVVDLHLAPGDGGRRERPRLEEARGPEPLVEADTF